MHSPGIHVLIMPEESLLVVMVTMQVALLLSLCSLRYYVHKVRYSILLFTFTSQRLLTRSESLKTDLNME